MLGPSFENFKSFLKNLVFKVSRKKVPALTEAERIDIDNIDINHNALFTKLIKHVNEAEGCFGT